MRLLNTHTLYCKHLLVSSMSSKLVETAKMSNIDVMTAEHSQSLQVEKKITTSSSDS